MENKMPTENDPSSQDKFQFSSTSLNVLLKIAEKNKGFRAGLGVSESAKQKAQRAKIDLERAFFPCRLTKLDSNRSVLTPEGHELARIAMEFNAALEAFKRKYRGLPPKITIAAGDSVVNWIILPAINVLGNQNGILFSVRQGGTKGLIELLTESQVDFIVVPEKAPLKESWESKTVGSYEYCICCPNSLLNGTKLNEAALSKLEFAMITKHWELDFLKKASDAAIKLNVKILCETFTQIASLVKQGLCAGVLPLSTMSSFPDESYSWFKPAFMTGTDRTLQLVWKPESSKIKSYVNEVALTLLKRLQDELEKKQNKFVSAIKNT